MSVRHMHKTSKCPLWGAGLKNSTYKGRNRLGDCYINGWQYQRVAFYVSIRTQYTGLWHEKKETNYIHLYESEILEVFLNSLPHCTGDIKYMGNKHMPPSNFLLP
jgi:hypothetical protein